MKRLLKITAITALVLVVYNMQKQKNGIAAITIKTPQLNITKPEPVKEPVKKEFVYFEEIPLNYDEQELVFNISKQHNVDYKLTLAIMKVESNYYLDCRSTTNDTGIMQINDINKERLNNHFGRELDLYNLEDSTLAGTLMIGEKLEHTDYDVSKALMCYNMGNTGAKRLFDNGIYESEYSIKVSREYDIIKEYYNARCYI